MINLTSIARPYFAHVDRIMLSRAMQPEEAQRAVLHDLTGLTDEDFIKRQSPVSYEDIRSQVMRMVDGERDVLCPGRVDRYAQSSGTSGGKSKYIPVSKRALKRCHYRGSTDVVARYLSEYRDSHLFGGKALILGGSFANGLDLKRPEVRVGDLSAHLIECINPLAGLLRVPDARTALMQDWHEKLPRLVAQVARENVVSLSGVPSWMMTVMKEVLKLTGASTIREVWPNLEVFFHGGISFEPYREEYRRLIGDDRMRYFETYNASEGFFAVQYRKDARPLLLLQDVDTFYEFVPVAGGDPVPVWEVIPGKVYEMIITNSAGLTRYRLGDTVKIESINPVTITIAGRTMQYINAFGEEVMVFNTDAALARTCEVLGASVADYTAGPCFATCGTRGHHQWLIEWTGRQPDIDKFAALLDENLRKENSDYDAKRTGDIFLDPLEIITVERGTFDRWLKTTGKLGGQRKIPRLSPDRRYLDEIMRHVHQDPGLRNQNIRIGKTN